LFAALWAICCPARGADPKVPLVVQDVLCRGTFLQCDFRGADSSPGKDAISGGNGILAGAGQDARPRNQESVRIALSNDGQPVPAAIAGRIFDPYVSGKSGKDNMGLGLAIVKKIVIDHGGEIAYVEEAGRPLFMISLPQVT